MCMRKSRQGGTSALNLNRNPKPKPLPATPPSLPQIGEELQREARETGETAGTVPRALPAQGGNSTGALRVVCVCVCVWVCVCRALRGSILQVLSM